MARQRILITDFSGGMVSRRVMGRLDVPYQQKTAEHIENFVVLPDGGITRRRGTIAVREGLGITPHADGLFGDKSTPAFALVRRGESQTEVSWLVWIQDGATPQLKAMQLQTRQVTTVASATLEAGEPIVTTPTFYSLPDADNVTNEDDQHFYLTTPGAAHSVNHGTNWALTLQAKRELAAIFQNRLITGNRAWGTLWMSEPLKMFQNDVLEDLVVEEEIPAVASQAEVIRFYVEHEIITPEEIDGETDVEDPYSNLRRAFCTFPVLQPDGTQKDYLVWFDTGEEDGPEDGAGDEKYLDYTPIKVAVTTGDTPDDSATVAQNMTAAINAAVTHATATYELITYDGWSKSHYTVKIASDEYGEVDAPTRGSAPWKTPDREVVGRPAEDAIPVQTVQVQTGAVEIVPDFYGAEQVRWMAARGSLYVGTDSGEYEIVSSLPYFSNEPGGAIVQSIGRVGADGAEFFAESLVLRRGAQLLRLIFSGQGYQTASMVSLLDNDELITHTAVDYGSHRYLFALDINRNLYALIENAGGGVSAWSLIATDVWWVRSYDQDIYVARQYAGDFMVEALPLDSLYYPGNRSAGERLRYSRLPAHADRGGMLTVTGSEVTGDVLPSDSTVNVMVWDGTAWNAIPDQFNVAGSGVIGDGIGVVHTAVGYTSDPVYIYCYDAGGEFTSRIRTLPLHIPAAMGPSLGRPAVIREVTVIVHESTAMRVRTNDGPWESWSVDTPFTGPVNFRVDGAYEETVYVEIESVGAEPLTISSIQADVEVSDP